MNVIELELSKITPYDKNPRKNDRAVNGVAESIKQFGFQQPLVVDKNNVIVVGHTRYKAAKKLGLSTVPCVRADQLTKEQVKAYRIADNKLNELATWDFDLLGEELQNFEFDFTPFEFDIITSTPEAPQMPEGISISQTPQTPSQPTNDPFAIPPDRPYEISSPDENDSGTSFNEASEVEGKVPQATFLRYKDYVFPMSEDEEVMLENVVNIYKEKYRTFFGFVGALIRNEIH